VPGRVGYSDKNVQANAYCDMCISESDFCQSAGNCLITAATTTGCTVISGEGCPQGVLVPSAGCQEKAAILSEGCSLKGKDLSVTGAEGASAVEGRAAILSSKERSTPAPSGPAGGNTSLHKGDSASLQTGILSPPPQFNQESHRKRSEGSGRHK